MVPKSIFFVLLGAQRVYLFKSAGERARRFLGGAALRRRRGAVDLFAALLQTFPGERYGWRSVRWPNG